MGRDVGSAHRNTKTKETVDLYRASVIIESKKKGRVDEMIHKNNGNRRFDIS